MRLIAWRMAAQTSCVADACANAPQSPPHYLPMVHPLPTDFLAIPLIVQVGFAGSRTLFESIECCGSKRDDMESELVELLVAQLRRLPAILGLSEHHMLCGVSQIAIGGDTAFTRACKLLGLRQRVLLPQYRDEYLAASSADGKPDFGASDQELARDLLGSEHIIEEYVASHSPDRHLRFEETNSHILRVSDIIIGLIPSGAGRKRGGTDDLLSRAAALDIPFATITLSDAEGKICLSPLPPLQQWTNASAFSVPVAPPELGGLCMRAPQPDRWPSAQSYIAQIQQFASRRSTAHGGRFRRSAVAIIGFHLLATALALWVGQFDDGLFPLIFLGGELLMLSAGLSVHVHLHHSAQSRVWALTRLVAEIMRSLAAVERFGGSLGYPLALPIPDTLVPVLRTCAVLHLADRSTARSSEWGARRADYLHRRLSAPAAQLHYYKTQGRKAAVRLKFVTLLFWICSSTAIGVTIAEVLTHAGQLPAGSGHLVEKWGGLIGVILPVAAVGALSWAAAGDLEARVHTFAQMHQFLSRQLKRLAAAGSERELELLVHETEQRLLGENINWFSRRFFTGVN